MARTQLYLVRHGEQDPVSEHSPDGGISPLGREQAYRLVALSEATMTPLIRA